jgi:hypothetical protein
MHRILKRGALELLLSDTAPAWYQPILDILDTAGGGYLWLHEVGVDAAVEEPVALWEDVTGVRAFAQPGVTSIRPTRKSDGVLFDGIDDRMNEDAELPTWIARASGPWTVGVGSTIVTANSTTNWWASTNNNTTSIVQYFANNRLGRAGGATIFTTAVNDTGPLSTWIAIAGAGAGQSLRRVSAAETTDTYGTQAAGILNFTLGARRTTIPGTFLSGRIAWVIVSPAALSSANMLAIENILAINGYPT